jgi:hypothetical protein
MRRGEREILELNEWDTCNARNSCNVIRRLQIRPCVLDLRDALDLHGDTSGQGGGGDAGPRRGVLGEKLELSDLRPDDAQEATHGNVSLVHGVKVLHVGKVD